jgi:hypothetical protein
MGKLKAAMGKLKAADAPLSVAACSHRSGLVSRCSRLIVGRPAATDPHALAIRHEAREL